MNAKHEITNNAGALVVRPSAAVLPIPAPLYETEFDTPKRFGMIIAFLVFGVFGAWAAFAPIGGAVHAVGSIGVKSYNKKVQHLEGGIVRDILVQNGDMVQKDDVLLIIDPTQSLAQLEIFNGQLF